MLSPRLVTCVVCVIGRFLCAHDPRRVSFFFETPVRVSQMYQFEVCPFRNVTQREYRPQEWHAIEEAQKPRNAVATSTKSTTAARNDGRPVRLPAAQVRQSDLGNATSLGMFVGWERGFGVAGVRSALSEAPREDDPRSRSGSDSEQDDDDRPLGLWAHKKLPPMSGGAAVVDGVVARFAYGDR